MKTVLVIGIGEFGRHLAYRLLELKAEVAIVDKNPEVTNSLSDDFENAFTADCTTDVALRDLGVKNYDTCVVATSEDFQTSLEITAKLKEQGAKHIISKASNSLQSKFLLMAGADETVYPEKDVASKTAQMCIANNVLDVFEISNEYSVYEIKMQNEWAGKALKETNIRSKYNLNVIAVRNRRGIEVPDPNYIFNYNDTIYVFGKITTLIKLSNK